MRNSIHRLGLTIRTIWWVCGHGSADEFLLPSNPTHRQSSAQFFVDRAPSAEAAERFDTREFSVLCHPSQKPSAEFFLPQTKKAKLLASEHADLDTVHRAVVDLYFLKFAGDGETTNGPQRLDPMLDGPTRKAPRTKVGGLFLFLPYLAKIPLDKSWPMRSSQAR